MLDESVGLSGFAFIFRTDILGWKAAMTRERSRGAPSGKDSQTADGIPSDWGKTRPFWCLSCGRGYRSVERVLAHYSEAAHGNESMSVGSRGLTKRQRTEAFRLRYK